MTRTEIKEQESGYWTVDIIETGKQSDTYYFLLSEDAMRFKDQVDSGRRDIEYLREQREIDFNRMKEISRQMGIIIGDHDEL